jgi:XTP/dITP diphosphohydrolase
MESRQEGVDSLCLIVGDSAFDIWHFTNQKSQIRNYEMEKKLEAFRRLLVIMDELREQCPWDRKQTFQTLRKLTIEETYELVDEILTENVEGIKEEVGDLMLHMVFYAKIGEEQGAFDIADALNGICEKLIKRHPHIYGDVKVDSEDDVMRNWEQLKLKEGKKSILQGVPNSLPALVKAMRMQEKTKQVGFEWETTEQVWEKVKEEVAELEEVVNENTDKRKIEDEFGDVLFSLVNYARFIDIDPEAALERTNRKFKRRFEFIEKNATKPLIEMSLEEMDVLWDQAKLEE